MPSVDQKEQIPNKEYKPYKSGSLAVESSKKDTLAPLAVNYQQETPETVDEELPQVSSTRKEGLYLPQTGMTTNFEVTSSVLGIVPFSRNGNDPTKRKRKLVLLRTVSTRP